MLKKIVAVAGSFGLLATAGLLAGCSGSAETASPIAASSTLPIEAVETADPASPRAFLFESGVLEFGDFDPYSIGENLFNPCTEITAEEYAAAGFPDIEIADGGELVRSLTYCNVPSSAEQDKRRIGTSFSNGNTNRAIIEEQGLLLPQYRSEPVSYTHLRSPRDRQKSRMPSSA